MARFQYQARDSKGGLASGVVAAASMEDAGKLLRGEGKYIVRLAAVADADAIDADDVLTPEQHARHVRRPEVIFFSHQLAVMIETGVPISDALACVSEQAPNPHFRELLKDIANHVQGGKDFSSALARHPRVFPTIMVSLLRASEVSGTMGRMLDRISKYLGKEHKIQRQVRGALAYPAFMLAVAVGVTVFLLAFVLPKFASIYSAKGSALPVPTQLLMALSNSAINYWWAYAGGAAAVAGALWAALRTAPGQRAFDWLKLHVPVARHLFTQLYVTRSCRTMGTMISSGVSMLDAVDIVRSVTDNVYYREMWDQVSDALQQGMQLSDPLHKSDLMPRSIVQMIRSGEKSGRLGEVMNRIAEFTEEEFDETVKTTTQFIEPLMVASMGVMIGFVAIALLLPIFSVGNVVAK